VDAQCLRTEVTLVCASLCADCARRSAIAALRVAHDVLEDGAKEIQVMKIKTTIRCGAPANDPSKTGKGQG
jgi:hypothetical protein